MTRPGIEPKSAGSRVKWICIYIYIYTRIYITEYMCFIQTADISTLNSCSLKLVDKFTYLESSISSTEKDIDTRLAKAWTAIDRLSVRLKSDLTDKIKRCFFQAAVVSILLYGCTTLTLTKRMEKKLIYLYQIVQKLNQVEPSTNFSYELEKSNSLLFLDILLINNNNELKF